MKLINRSIIIDKINKAIIKFEEEYMGSHPTQAITFINNDIICILIKGILSPAEEQLVQNKDGENLLKVANDQLIEGEKNILEKLIYNITNNNIKSMESHINIENKERIIIFHMKNSMEDQKTIK